MKKETSETILGLSIFALLGAGGFLWYQYDSTQRPQQPQQKPVKIDAITLHAAYGSNELAADRQYAGKILRANGVVTSVQRDTDGKPYVRLFPGIVCSFDREERSLLEIAVADDVTTEYRILEQDPRGG